MAVDVRTEIVIDWPIAEVAAYAADPTNAPDWYVNIKSVEWKTPPPITGGSRMDFVAQFLGRRLAYTYEITELEPQALLDAHRGRPVPNGDHVCVDGHRRHPHSDDTAQPR